MSFLRYLSPLRAIRDLRDFLASRKKHELFLFFPALILTAGVIYAFARDSQFEKEYERKIIYFDSWPITRTDEEIRAKQKIDQPRRDAERAALLKKQEERRQEFRDFDNSLEAWGF